MLPAFDQFAQHFSTDVATAVRAGPWFGAGLGGREETDHLRRC